MWYDTSVFYQIYPLGFCGTPRENDGVLQPRIQKVLEWADYFASLGVGAIYFSPVFFIEFYSDLYFKTMLG